jgi:hypothetical protein
MESSLDSVRVTQLLKQIHEIDGLAFSESDKTHVGMLAELALTQVQQASEDQFESQLAKAENALGGTGTDDGRRKLCASHSWTMCESLSTVYSSFTESLCPYASERSHRDEANQGSFVSASRIPTPIVERDDVTVTASHVSLEIDKKHSSTSTSPPSCVEPAVAKSRSTASSSATAQLEKALFISGLEIDELDYDQRDLAADVDAETRRRHLNKVQLQWSTVSRLYHEDFDHLRKSGRIRVSFANTYQGRLPGSTNGCTVIAPLLCIHHLLNDELPDPGLTDAVIVQVIDEETPAILSELRLSLQLSLHAFLIPSDAHDYLIENGQLSQENFVAVSGGNVLSHLEAFVETLDRAERRKVAACFFFHEHVVAILKVRRDGRISWYDVIDGLPLHTTYARMGASDQALPEQFTTPTAPDSESDVVLRKTARVRCLDLEALTVCLRWYACSKFSAENLLYIDHYEWDDASCDFDPRVFQGFVWGSCD